MMVKNSNAKRRRVLFVDDETQITRGIRTALHKEPYEVLVANSGQAALDILAQTPIDVVVSDAEMSGMSGSEFLTIVRDRHPETVRLVLTGQASVESAVEAINEAAVYRFLMKPCAPEDLALVVSQALNEREQMDRFERWKRTDDGPERADRQAAYAHALKGSWMAFQPIVVAATRRVFAYEALLRTDDEGINNPGAVIGLAEELGCVWELDGWIRQLASLQLEGMGDATVLINTHPQSLEDPALFADSNPLHAFASQIVLEITERQSLEKPELLRDQVAKLRERGYRIAVDDLGAGYAGLTSISMLTPDIVKFDMELMRDIHTSATKTKLVGAMTSLCQELGILTVAEGIETEGEHQTAVELGCDLLQGFYYGLPARELAGTGVQLG